MKEINVLDSTVVLKPVKIKISQKTDWALKVIAAKERVGVSYLRGQILENFVSNYERRK